MNTSPPLDLRAVAEKLGVRFYRVRRFRDNSIHGRGMRRLCTPDVADIPRNPLWSESAIEAWAKAEGLWPPGVDQYECGYCGETLSVYEGDSPVLRPHGWSEAGDGRLWPCEGSYQKPGRHAVRRERSRP